MTNSSATDKNLISFIRELVSLRAGRSKTKSIKTMTKTFLKKQQKKIVKTKNNQKNATNTN